MNLKAYLRGIGAGMIVSALVIGVGRATAPKPSEPIDKSTLKTSVSSVVPVSVSETSEDKGPKDKDPESDIKTSTVSSAGTEGSDNEKETETPG